MGFQYPPSTLWCVVSAIKTCFDDLDGNELTVKCHFDGCWKAKELAGRIGLDISIVSGTRDTDCPRTLDGCVETSTPTSIVLQLDAYAETCRNADELVMRGMALVDHKLCQCAANRELPLLDLERSNFRFDSPRDASELTRNYRRFRQNWNAKTIIDACDPGALVTTGCSHAA